MVRQLNGSVGSTELERKVKGRSIGVTSFRDLDINKPWSLTYKNCILAIRCVYGFQKIFRIKRLPPVAASTDR
jgi:hypothetical protein